MAIERTEIHSQRKGSMGEDEDWWTLLVDSESGEKTVEHEWSYTNAYGPGQDSGTQIVTVDEFLAGNSDQTAKAKLRELLDA